MKKLKKDLRAITKEVKALATKTEKLMKAADRLEKAQAAKKRKAKTKAKTTRKAPAKKKVAARKSSALTATDKVLKIINRSKKGVNVPTLIKKTRFDDKKVRNILMRASKQRKIKRAGRGIYRGT